MTRRQPGLVARIAVPLKAATERLATPMLIVMALAFVVLGRLDDGLTLALRIHVADALAPVLDTLSRPVQAVGAVGEEVARLGSLQTENERLRAENALLTGWKDTALQLEAENRSLRRLLHVNAGPEISFRTARVVADEAGTFGASKLITAGRMDGICPGHAALGGDGLAGRVVEVGQHSARVLLLTDVSSRVPVMLQGSGHRAILAGRGKGQRPRLDKLPGEADPLPGTPIVTSGSGGLFPPGLAVGMVAGRGDDGGVLINLRADLERLDFLRLANYGVTAISGCQPGTEPVEQRAP